MYFTQKYSESGGADKEKSYKIGSSKYTVSSENKFYCCTMYFFTNLRMIIAMSL